MLIAHRPDPASLAHYCQLAPEELAHLEPHEHEPLEELAGRLREYQAGARTNREQRKYAEQQETLRDLVRDPSLSPQARGSVVSGWFSSASPGYWLKNWQQMTAAPREVLYCQADKLLSFEPASVRAGLEALPSDNVLAACRTSLGESWTPPVDVTQGELAAAAHAVHCLSGVAFQGHARTMLKGLFAADMPATYRQRGFELVGDRLHSLRFSGDGLGYVTQVTRLFEREGLDADVRIAVMEQLEPDLDVDHAVEAATLRYGLVSGPATGVLTTTTHVAFNGVFLRKRAV